MSTHTPGPWTKHKHPTDYDRIDIRHGDTLVGCVLFCSNEANMDLLLAAPDLLAACEAASSQVPTWSREGELSDVYRQISSAITKARGETNP